MFERVAYHSACQLTPGPRALSTSQHHISTHELCTVTTTSGRATRVISNTYARLDPRARESLPSVSSMCNTHWHNADCVSSIVCRTCNRTISTQAVAIVNVSDRGSPALHLVRTEEFVIWCARLPLLHVLRTCPQHLSKHACGSMHVSRKRYACVSHACMQSFSSFTRDACMRMRKSMSLMVPVCADGSAACR